MPRFVGVEEPWRLHAASNNDAGLQLSCTNLLFSKCVAGSWQRPRVHDERTTASVSLMTCDPGNLVSTLHGLGCCTASAWSGLTLTYHTPATPHGLGGQAGWQGWKDWEETRVPQLSWVAGTCPDSSQTRLQAITLLFLG